MKGRNESLSHTQIVPSKPSNGRKKLPSSPSSRIPPSSSLAPSTTASGPSSSLVSLLTGNFEVVFGHGVVGIASCELLKVEKELGFDRIH